jgi:hypothetical protein
VTALGDADACVVQASEPVDKKIVMEVVTANYAVQTEEVRLRCMVGNNGATITLSVRWE